MNFTSSGKIGCYNWNETLSFASSNSNDALIYVVPKVQCDLSIIREGETFIFGSKLYLKIHDGKDNSDCVLFAMRNTPDSRFYPVNPIVKNLIHSKYWGVASVDAAIHVSVVRQEDQPKPNIFQLMSKAWKSWGNGL